MQVDLRQPLIQGSDKEQLAQIKSYLFQLREQLQWAFEHVESAEGGQNNTTVVKQIMSTPTGTQDPQETFASIKNLIIKSADIIDAYYEDISERLTGVYVAQSEFGTYREETDASITANAKNIIVEQEKIEKISNVYQDHQDNALVVKSSGFIKTGFLGEGKGYGVEIGQRVEADGKEQFKGSARFVTTGVEFDDENGTKSAWLTRNRLHANEVEAVKKQIMGGFVDEVDENGDVTTRWVGKVES
jgi:hypothetical protein